MHITVCTAIKKKSYYSLTHYIIDIMKHMLYFFSVSANIFIHEYTVNAGNVSSYDSLSRHVGLDILEYWSEMLRL